MTKRDYEIMTKSPHSFLRQIHFVVNVTWKLQQIFRYDRRFTTKRSSLLIRFKPPITTNLQGI